MVSKVPEEKQIISYLLGELPEDEQAPLEERFLRDVDYREIIRSVEDDLIDDYLQDELSAGERKLFEEHFAPHPHRRQKLEFARALRKSFVGFEATSTPDPAVRVPEKARDHRWWSSLLSPFRGFPNWAVGVSLAVVFLLLVVGGAWFIREIRRVERERVLAEQRKQQQEQSQPSPGTSPAERDQVAPGANSPPPESRETIAGGKDQVGEPGPPETPTPQPQVSVATLILPPGMARGSGEGRTLLVPRTSRLVRLQVGLEEGETYPAYRAELRKVSGDLVWRSGTIRAGRVAQSLTLNVRPELLTSEKYELKLSGLKGKEPAEDIGYYYFTIRKE